MCKVTESNHKLYCAYNGTAKPVNDEGKKLLSTWCPHLLEEHNNNLCCDNEQVRTVFFVLNLFINLNNSLNRYKVDNVVITQFYVPNSMII